MKYVALLRGINVVGKNKIEMKVLREVFSMALGFENVKTYINSGNVIFETLLNDDGKLAEKIESAIEREFSLKIKTIVRTMDEIADVIKNNPFDGQFESHKDLHVFFLDEPLPDEKREQLLANNTDNEKFAVRGREIFHFCRDLRFPDSLAGKDYIGKKLKVSATARNWRTLSKILEM
jgi:uncharacterized protein (DUF1697 family)